MWAKEQGAWGEFENFKLGFEVNIKKISFCGTLKFTLESLKYNQFFGGLLANNSNLRLKFEGYTSREFQNDLTHQNPNWKVC